LAGGNNRNKGAINLFSFFSLFSSAYGFLSHKTTAFPLFQKRFHCYLSSRSLLRLSFLLIKKLIGLLLSSFFCFIPRKNICITVSASSSKHSFHSSFQTILLHHNRFPTYFSLFLSSEYSDHLDSTCWMRYSCRNSIQSGNRAYLFLFFHFFSLLLFFLKLITMELNLETANHG